MIKVTSLLTWLCVMGSGMGLSASAERGLVSARPSERPGFAGGSAEARNGTLPLETQYAVSAALGRDQTAYHVLPNREPLNHAETSYQAANPNQHFNMRFDAQGACIANDGMLWNLSVREWGYGDEGTSEFSADQASPERGGESAWQAVTDTPLLRYSVTASSAVRLSVSANRVEYRRDALTEWYVNGPLGLQQGFTVNAPPARLGTGGPVSRGPLTFVLNLPDGGHAQVDADRKGLTLLTDEKERTCPPAYIAGRSPAGRQSLRSSPPRRTGGPSLRYSGLTALDADGVRLPAWLEIQNHNHAQPCEALGKRVVKLLLRVDDSGARYPIAIDPFIQQAKLISSDGAANNQFGRSVALSSDGKTACAGAYGVSDFSHVIPGAAYVFAVLTPPTGVAASDDFYIDRVWVSWDAAVGATGYEVWRGTSNDTAQAARIGTGISGTNYDDLVATAGTPYYYWVKTTNASGASAFSTSAIGRVLFGPDVRLNGAAGPVIMAAGSALVVTVSLNPAQYAGYPMDWWVVVSTPVGLYYFNGSLVWTPASDFSALQPVYQGGLFGLQSEVVLDTTALPAGTYTFYFGVDTLNSSLDPDVVYDSATVTVTP